MVKVTVGDESNYERHNDLLWFVSGKENIDWSHVQYLVFSDTDGKLIGTMGPGRFRHKLLDESAKFLKSLRTKETSGFLEFGDDVHVKSTATKSEVLRRFAKRPLRWFPVVDGANKLVGIIEPQRLAISLVADIAAVLSHD